MRKEVIRVEESTQLTSHAKVVNKERLLVDVLEKCIFPILQRESDTVFEVVMCCDNAYFLCSSLNLLVSHYFEVEIDEKGSLRVINSGSLFSPRLLLSETHDDYGVGGLRLKFSLFL